MLMPGDVQRRLAWPLPCALNWWHQQRTEYWVLKQVRAWQRTSLAVQAIPCGKWGSLQ